MSKEKSVSHGLLFRPTALVLALCAGAIAGCSNEPGSSPSPGAGGVGGEDGTGGGGAGRTGAGGTSGAGGRGGAGPAGNGGTGQTGSGGESGAGGQAGSGTGGLVGTADAGVDSSAPATADAASPDGAGGQGGGGNPTYEGELPLYKGPPVGPEVAMACPGDPTAGFVEYEDTFHVEHPYDLPVNTRFKIENGVYHYWVQRNDKPLNRTTKALNPRTEARYKMNFTSGIRMWTGDVYLEKNTNGSVIMQVHTTTTGIGPVYLHVEGNNRLDGSTVKAADIPGGLFDNWFNLKVIINGATTESQIFINNCLKTTQRGVRGNGINYFKNGVYHCEENAVCRTRFKNVKLWLKQ